MVICERRLWNKTTIEVRHYISSLSADAQEAHAVHPLGIGKFRSLTLDVTFLEKMLAGSALVRVHKLCPAATNCFESVQRETRPIQYAHVKRYRAALITVCS